MLSSELDIMNKYNKELTTENGFDDCLSRVIQVDQKPKVDDGEIK